MPVLDTEIRPMSYQVHSYYPHMAPEDTELWSRYITENPAWASLAWYDFPVGTIPPAIKNDDVPWVKPYGIQTYSKRIDVVVPIGNVVNVIEIKPSASACALGQVLLYRHCIKVVLGKNVTAQAIIITDKADPDLLEINAKYNVRIIELGTPGG